MLRRDIATFTFRVLGLWLILDSVSSVADVVMKYRLEPAYFQSDEVVRFFGADHPIMLPLGLLIWLGAPRMANLVFPKPADSKDRLGLAETQYRVAWAVVGTWLAVSSLPKLLYFPVFVASTAVMGGVEFPWGTESFADIIASKARFLELTTCVVIGLLLVRNTPNDLQIWFRREVLGLPVPKA